MTAPISYLVATIQSSLLLCKVPLNFAESGLALAPAYKLEITVTSDTQISIRFGVKIKADGIESEDLSVEESFVVITELVGIFNVSSPLPKLSKVTELPVIANMVATMFPFTRERVASLLGSSGIQYFLESFNVVGFINEFDKMIQLNDLRE